MGVWACGARGSRLGRSGRRGSRLRYHGPRKLSRPYGPSPSRHQAPPYPAAHRPSTPARSRSRTRKQPVTRGRPGAPLAPKARQTPYYPDANARGRVRPPLRARAGRGKGPLDGHEASPPALPSSRGVRSPRLLGTGVRTTSGRTPSFRTFAALVTGLIVQTRRRTVVGMLLGAGY
jgi:hypothetical protein